MATFKYRSKGTADEWTTDTIQADNKQEAQGKLDAIYGIERDEKGKQITPNISVEIL